MRTGGGDQLGQGARGFFAAAVDRGNGELIMQAQQRRQMGLAHKNAGTNQAKRNGLGVR
jgi:hypothetical protein